MRLLINTFKFIVQYFKNLKFAIKIVIFISNILTKFNPKIQ